jgi:cytochrome c oxidase subunit 4
MANHSTKPAAFDELDPHHTGAHTSHVIIGPALLRGVLGVLLLLTVLTVTFARLEVWASDYFGIALPHWINVVGAMSIAIVKALLVMAFFMQLKYDNPINTFVMFVTFGALAIFIAFTGMDLFNRDKVYHWKKPQIVAGGLGGSLWPIGDRPIVTSSGEPIAVAARNRYRALLAERIQSEHPELEGDALEKAVDARFEEVRLASESHAAHGHGIAHEDIANTPNRSRPIRGLTGALDTTPPPDMQHSPAGH